MDHLTIANSIHLYGHVLRRALDFEVEDQRKKWWPKRAWKRQVEEESVKVALKMENALC